MSIDVKDYFFEIINQAANGITLTDPNQFDNPLIFANQAFYEMFGYDKDEVIGLNCRFLQHEDKDQVNLEKIRDAIKYEKQTTTVLRNYTKDGKLILNEIRVSPIFDKKTKELKYFLGIQKVISSPSIHEDKGHLQKLFDKEKFGQLVDKKDIQILLQEFQTYEAELLAQNEELVEKDKKLMLLNTEFEALFKEAPMPLLLVDEQLQIKKFNNSADEYFSFSQSKISIKSLFAYINKNSIEKLLRWIQYNQYLQDTIDVDMNCFNNETRRFKIKAKRYNLDSGLLLFTLSDIQEQYEVQTDLEQKVQEQLQKALDQEKFIQEQAKLASMGEMIDAIAHQWRQPLGLLTMRADFLLQMNEGNDFIPYEEVKECKESNLSQINHLVETLEQFRDFLRPNKITQRFSLEKMINSVLLLIKDDIIKHCIEVSFDTKEDIEFDGVENELKHVLINILNNSKDIFTERNIQDREIQIELIKKDKYIQITIDDNAGGIPKNIVEKLFENHISEREGGTGIGLYMSKQIITKLAGTIEY